MLFLKILFSIRCWSMWYDSVLYDANLVDYRAMMEVLKWFTPCWTSDFFRYIMKDMILDLLQCAIPWSWDCWVFWVGDNQQYLFPPMRFYNGFHLIIFFVKFNVDRCDMIVCYGMQIWLITGLCFFEFVEVLKWFTPCWTNDFFRYIMKDMILDLLQCATHCFLGLLGILGGW